MIINYREPYSSNMYIIDRYNMTQEHWVYRQNGKNALEGIPGKWELLRTRNITAEEIMDIYEKIITSYNLERVHPNEVAGELDDRYAKDEAETAEWLSYLNGNIERAEAEAAEWLLRIKMEELATGE